MKQFALCHIVSEVHQACSPVPQSDERPGSASDGSSIDALPLANAFRCPIRLGDMCSSLYKVVQAKLGVPPGSFLLWAAKRRSFENGYALRPAVLWPGCAWLSSDASIEQDPEIVQVCCSCVVFFRHDAYFLHLNRTR